jgi:DNA-binding transcriptional LysR family regulator
MGRRRIGTVLDAWSLQILTTVATRGSFSGAAEELVLTQPAVSRQVAALERRLGVALFRRTARGVDPTPAGEVAVDLARGVLARIDALEATMRTFAGIEGGRVRVAGFSSVNTHYVPDAMRRFEAEHPSVTISLHHVDPFAVLDSVRDGTVDVALVTEWQLEPDPWTARTRTHPTNVDLDAFDGVELTPLVEEELRVALPATHRLARRRRVVLADLRDERWIDGAYPDCLGPLRPLGDALGAPPRIGFMCDDWNGKQALVAGGMGVMVVPTLAAPALRGDIVVVSTSPTLPHRRLFAATARPPFRSPAAGAMLAVLRG